VSYRPGRHRHNRRRNTVSGTYLVAVVLFLLVVGTTLCKNVQGYVVPAGEALFQVASEIGAGQAVDEEINAVVAEEDRAGDVDPAACRVRLCRVVR